MANNGLPDFSQQQRARIAQNLLKSIDQGPIIAARAAQLDPVMQDNYNAIVAKYPNMSKDSIIAAVQKGITANMDGLEKIATADGLAQLISDKTRLENLARAGKENRGVGEALWATLKGVSRVGFAALQHPYQVVTNVFRNLYALEKGEVTSQQAFGNIAKAGAGFGKETNFGSLINDIFDGGGIDVGTGFFIDPKSKVGKSQQDAFAAYGQVAGKSYTIGRGTLSGLGAHPNSTFYRVTSGIIDATLNVALDPTTWVPAGLLGGAAKGGKAAKEAVIASRDVQKVTREEAAKLADDLRAKAKELSSARKDARRTVEDGVSTNLDKLTKAEQSALKAEETRALKILTSGEKRAATAEKEIIDNDALLTYVKGVEESGNTNQLISSLGKLSADNIQTKGVFEGHLFLEFVPQKKAVTVAAQGDKEFLVTAVKGKRELNLVDITKPVDIADEKSLSQWVKFSNELNKRLGKVSGYFNRGDFPIESVPALKKILGNKKIMPNAAPTNMVELALFKNASPAMILKAAVETGDPHVIDLVSEAFFKTYKGDGYSNIRAIFGGQGGIVVTNPAKIAARQVRLSEYLTGAKPPRMAAATLTKIDDILLNTQKELEAARGAHASAIKARKDFDTNIQAIRLARGEFLKDPQALRKLISDPEDIGIAKYVDLEEEILTDLQKYKETLRAETGLVNTYGGSLANNVEKALQFVLGKNFAPIVKLIAQEKSFSRLDNLLGRKAPVDMVKELADATTIGQVESVFLKYLGALDTDPIRFRGVLLRMAGQVEKATNPFVKIVPNYRMAQALALAEATERRLGSFYVRTTVLPLDDLDRLVSGMRDWLESARVPGDISDNLINSIVNARNPKQRSGALSRALEDAHIEIARRFTAKNPAAFDTAVGVIQDAFRFEGKDKILARIYYPKKIAENNTPTGMILNGQEQAISREVAHFEYQMLDDIIKLPDTRAIEKVFRQYNQMALRGKAWEARGFLESELGDRWRTAQLAFRIAFIARNIGEMQARMYLAGHETLFNHPVDFLAMMAANPNGSALQKIAARISRYNNDLLGGSMIDDAIEKGLNGAADQHFEFLNRTMYAYGTRNSWIGKFYETVDHTSDRYHVGLANTISNFRGDRLISAVARAITPKQQEQLIKELVGTTRVSDPIVDLIMGGKRNGLKGDSFWATALLKDLPNPSNLRIEDITPERINVENLRAWLFNENPEQGSVINAIKTVTANNPYMRELIGTGEVIMPNGKKVTAPIYKYDEDAMTRRAQGSDFKTALRQAFPSEDMVGSTVIYNTRKVKVDGKLTGSQVLDNWIDWFFDKGTRAENIMAYGPEFRMSYWDYAGKYAQMLGNDDLAKAYKEAVRTLSPIRKGKVAVGRRHPTIRLIEKEMKRREKSGISETGLLTMKQLDSLAYKSAANNTKKMFYDAGKQRNFAAQIRLIFPFAQAQYNTMDKWFRLMVKNPQQVYKFGRAYNSLTQPGSSAIYDLTGIEYNDNEGFIYKDEFGESRFRYPLSGTISGALAGKMIDGPATAQAMQFTAPVQALNLALGSVNPLVPGVGPVGQFAMRITGKDEAFGPGPEFLRKLILPFGVPAERQGLVESVLPSWANKIIGAVTQNDKIINQKLKPWAEYLASTGDYGDNPLADDSARTKLFEDARAMAKWTIILQGVFQSIAPATPSQELFAADKDGNMRTQTILYKSWQDNLNNNPGNYYGAVKDFTEEYGLKNILTILGMSTKAVQGTQDAWDFLNKNPELAKKYAVKDKDVVPYFFAGGTAAMAYYNWQIRTQQREPKSPAELEQEAEALIYSMKKSQIEDTQKEYGKSNLWYVNEVKKLGTPPELVQTINVKENQIDAVGRALQEEAFKDSPIYEDTLAFYNAFVERRDRLSEVRTAISPSFSGKSFLAQKMQVELENMATQIMLRNPAFSRMYYGVFAGQLKVKE